MNTQLHLANFRPLSPMSAGQWWYACGETVVRIETILSDKTRGGSAER